MGERTGFRRTWFKGKPEILGTFVCRMGDTGVTFSALWNGKNWIQDGCIVSGITEWTSTSLVGEEFIETCKDTDDRAESFAKYNTLTDINHCYHNSLGDFDTKQSVESRGGSTEEKMVSERTANAQDIRTISGELSRLRELNKIYTELENQSKKLLTNINGCQYMFCEPENDKPPILGLAEEMALCNDILYARYYGIKENLEIIKNLIG